MRRAVGYVLLVVVVGLIAAACSGDDSEDSSSTDDSVATSQPETEETTTQPEAEQTSTQPQLEQTTTTVFSMSDATEDEARAFDMGCFGAYKVVERAESLDVAEIANPLIATFPTDSDLAVFGQRLTDATTPEEQQQVLTELLAACTDKYGMIVAG
jgi:hypothetical protein